MVDPQEIASTWLADLDKTLASRSARATAELFLPIGWLRDSLIFSWDNRSLEGRDKIEKYLSVNLPRVMIGKVQLDKRPSLAPHSFPASPGLNGVGVAFTFETPALMGRGYARLLPGDSAASGSWKALSVFLAADDIKGHEEAGHEPGLYGGHTISWPEIREARRAEVEKDPQVIILGAGQNGLQVAARFRQMRIRTIIIERNERVGDNWRQRYPTLTLHTPRTHHNFLYAPFPSNWPTFTPRDKLAAWMEMYADLQDLVVWTSSEITPSPSYDDATGRWTVQVNKNGTDVTLHPQHIVIATGTLGDPFLPSIPDSEIFRGDILHASSFPGGERFVGKRVVVLGAGNTAADVCQDLYHRGAAQVTMVQRSETCVVSAALVADELGAIWAEGDPVDVGDLKLGSMPLGLLKQLSTAMSQQKMDFDQEMHGSLRRRGLKLNYGPDNAGQLFLFFERLGGYWIDVGVARLIAAGKVEVKQGVEIQRFTPGGMIFTDGSALDAEAVVFATGYNNIRHTMKKVFGAEMIDRTNEVWGLDEEGELKGCYRPSGQPGLWYAAGDFFHSRFMSKQMALHIRASQLGLTNHPCPASIPASNG